MTRCASASLRIRNVSGCPETIPKVCPIQVSVVGSVRPCSPPPARTLSCKTQKTKKKDTQGSVEHTPNSGARAGARSAGGVGWQGDEGCAPG